MMRRTAWVVDTSTMCMQVPHRQLQGQLSAFIFLKLEIAWAVTLHGVLAEISSVCFPGFFRGRSLARCLRSLFVYQFGVVLETPLRLPHYLSRIHGLSSWSPVLALNSTVGFRQEIRVGGGARKPLVPYCKERESASIMRSFLCRALKLPASKTTFHLGTLANEGVIIPESYFAEYFYEHVSTDDRELLHIIKVGVPWCQQGVESLTLLVSLRVYAAVWGVPATGGTKDLHVGAERRCECRLCSLTSYRGTRPNNVLGQPGCADQLRCGLEDFEQVWVYMGTGAALWEE